MTIALSLSDFEGHLLTASLFKCDMSYSRAAVDKVSIEVDHRDH